MCVRREQTIDAVPHTQRFKTAIVKVIRILRAKKVSGTGLIAGATDPHGFANRLIDYVLVFDAKVQPNDSKGY